jgi:hypothetical protein
VECLRLPGTLPWPERVTLAREWVGEFNPDWVSLQFVPFGFHPKGLCFGFEKHLKAIIGNRPFHWMFHELWVLWAFPLSLKKRILGQMQKLWLRSALNQLKPPAVSTQLPIYQAELRKLGVTTELLPLHGNIPVLAKQVDAISWLQARCSLPDIGEVTAAGFFGDILSTLDRALFAACLVKLRVPGKSLLLLSAGRLGGAAAQLWDSLAEEFKNSATFQKLGELHEREASLYFSALDYGLTGYPPELMGKSGSVAAMREHGLPVVSCALHLDGSLSSSLVAAGPNPNRPWTVIQSAQSLLQQLKMANV